MKYITLKILTLTAVASACLLNTGCGSTRAPKYFELQPIPAGANESITCDNLAGKRVIDIGPIVVPEYLGKSQIAVAGNGPEIFYSDQNRWSSSMDEGVLSVLIQNIRPILPDYWIARFQSFNDTKSDYSVGIIITKFDGTPGSNATLNVQWIIFSDSREKVCRLRSETFRKDVPEKTYASLVETQSKLLAELSRSIAADIEAVRKDKSATQKQANESAVKK